MNNNGFLGSLLIELSILIIVLIVLRISFLIHKVTRPPYLKIASKQRKSMKTLIVIGSGGHTTEMLRLIEIINKNNYTPRYYVIAKTDKSSALKVHEMEDCLAHEEPKKSYEIVTIPRSRQVMQSYFTSIFTTFYGFIYSIPILLKVRPNLIICNGPGTCIPLCVASFGLRCMFILDTKIVFIESFCRTKTLSLTGKILLYFADHMLVQWPLLSRKYNRVEYIGHLI